MFPNGPLDISHSIHVPAPGRVQYYRAEALPFVPNEIRCQLRFPKAYAYSVRNLRYLEKVKEETKKFLSENVKANYLNGDKEISFST